MLATSCKNSPVYLRNYTPRCSEANSECSSLRGREAMTGEPITGDEFSSALEIVLEELGGVNAILATR